MGDVLARIELAAVDLPYQSKVQFRSSQGSSGRYALLRLTTGAGAEGIAEVTGIANVVDSDPAILAAQIERFFRPLLVGADPLDRERIGAALERVRGGAIAKALIDTALWDLRGKLAGQPVWRLLGAPMPPPPVPVTAILFGDTSAAMLDEAVRTVERGIRALKVKLWRHSLDDVHLVRDIRRAVGDDVLIYADANHAYNEDEARALLPQLVEYGVRWIEDPCAIPPERLALLARDVPIAILSEIPIDSPAAARRYVDLRAAAAISVHPRRTGITETLEIAALCKAAGVPAILGTDLEAGIGALARVHLRAAVPSLAPWPSEIGFFERLAGDVLAEPLAVENGAIAVPDRPGFGATIDEVNVKRYQVR